MNNSWTILIVDDEPNNLQLLKQILSSSQYNLIFARNAQSCYDAVQRKNPDLILLDVMMPDVDGYEVCKTLKSDEKSSKIPIIFVTALSDEDDEEKGLELGAVDYITKPVKPKTVLARVANHLALSNQQKNCESLVFQRTKQLEEISRSAIYMLGEAGHYNDTDTGVHIWRMAEYSAAIAKAVNWPVEKWSLIQLAAPMHDTGKIGIPDDILKAPRKLSDEEWIIMKNHSEIGHKILSEGKTDLFRMAAEIAYYHHEKWDGSGYPKGLAGDDIPLSARIVSIADVFDALTMKRPYKEAWSIEKSLDHISKDAGKHFDPFLVESFLKIKEEIIFIKKVWDQQEENM